MLINLKSRGLENVSLFVSDALTSLLAGWAFSKRSSHRHISKSKAPNMWTHLMRNIENKVRAKDKTEVAEDAKEIYSS